MRFGILCVISLSLFKKLDNYSRIWQFFAGILQEGCLQNKVKAGPVFKQREYTSQISWEWRREIWSVICLANSHPVCCFKIQLHDCPSPVAFEHYIRTDTILLLPQAEQQFGLNVKKVAEIFHYQIKNWEASICVPSGLINMATLYLVDCFIVTTSPLGNAQPEWSHSLTWLEGNTLNKVIQSRK